MTIQLPFQQASDHQYFSWHSDYFGPHSNTADNHHMVSDIWRYTMWNMVFSGIMEEGHMGIVEGI